MKNLYTFLFALCVVVVGFASSETKAESFGFPSYGTSFGGSCSSCGGMGIGSYQPSSVVAVKVTVAPIYTQPYPYYPAPYYGGGGACGSHGGCGGGGYPVYGPYPYYPYQPYPYYPYRAGCGYGRCRRGGFVAVSWGFGSVAVGW